MTPKPKDDGWDDRDLAQLVDALPDAVAVIDGEGRLRWGNSAAERLFGWPIAHWVGASGLDLVHPDDLEMALLSLLSVQDKEVGTPLEIRVRTATGWKLVELVGAPLKGRFEGHVTLCLRDLTERRRWEVASGDESGFRTLIHNSAMLILLVLPNGDVQSVSASLTRMLGHDPEIVEGSPLVDLVHPADRELFAAAFRRALALAPQATQQPVTVEVRLTQRSRQGTVPFELSIVNLLDDPTVGGFVVSGHDISSLRAAQAELELLARNDALTGLPNRSSLDAHLSQVLAGGQPVAVAFLDLDRFKPVNDLFGHNAGDELLRQLAGRLTAEMRAGDFVARFGGDEFVVITPANGVDVGGLIERLESLVSTPFALASGPAQVFASVGVALSTSAHSSESLLAEADAAMYAVKRARRGNPTNPVLALSDRRELSEQLASALRDNQFEIHYQPIWALDEDDLAGFEALVRWRHPRRGLLYPAAFLDVVEDAGRDADLGELVLRSACGFAVAFAPGGTTIAVNISGGQVATEDFPSVVASVLEGSGLAPGRLCLEISERSILDRPAHGPATSILRNLERLALLGVQLAIDDFGTGYSSMTHVLEFPVSVLKIDQSFVQRMTSDRQSHSIVAALLELSRGMGIRAVAEGIETQDQLAALRALGCPAGQGYLLGRPEPALEASLRRCRADL